MYPVTSRWVDAVTHSHTAIVRAELWRGNTPVLLDGSTTLSLKPVAGSVEIDADAAVRRTLDASFSRFTRDGTDLVVRNSDPSAPLSPYGTELRVWRGIRHETPVAELGDSRNEWVPLGRFRIEADQIEEDGDGMPTVRVRGVDLSATLQTPPRNPIVIPGGTEVGDVVSRIIAAKNPALNVTALQTRFVVPTEVVIGIEDDPLDRAIKFAESAGAEVFADEHGAMVMQPSTLRTSSTYVWNFAEGRHSGFAGMTRTLDTQKSANVVTVIGNSSAATGSVRVTVWDDDPTSPTYVGGPYGEIHKVVRTELATSADQATEMARAILANSLGASEEQTFEATCNAAFQVGDTISTTRERVGSVNRYSVIRRLSIPLTVVEHMKIATRRLPRKLFEFANV